MLSKCANPACSARFRYLHEGRIFSAMVNSNTAGEHAEDPRRVERYWLCDTCAQMMTLVLSAGHVVLRPVNLRGMSGSRRGGMLAA